MLGRDQWVGAVSLRWRRHYLVSRFAFICLMGLSIALCSASIAGADVDTTGALRVVTSPGGIKPLVSAESEDYECTAKYSDIQSGAFTWVIGNCPKGSILEAVVRRSHTESEPENYSLGGFVNGTFQGCGWIEDEKFKPKAKKSKPTTACTEIASGKYEVAESNFMSKHNSGAGDGYYVVNKTACPEYANYRPWSSSNLEQEKLRTEPAYARQESGSSYPALKWRYTTKYNSTDGTGQYVMVRDVSVAAGEGNWVFVPRSCLPTTLPENESERVPSPPVVTTGNATNLSPTSTTLHGTVNPNGVETKYHFEYWTTGSHTPITEGNAGSGKGGVEESASIVGLQPGTTYHFDIVATSATGTSTGIEKTLITPGPVEAVTGAATGIQQTKATLVGTVNPRGYDAKYYFEYGTGSNTARTTEEDAGEGLNPVTVKAIVGNLTGRTTYHYRLVATSGGITSEGSSQPFTTLPPMFWVNYNSAGSLLETYSESPASNTSKSMAPGTSPSITALPSGGYVVAFQANNGSLYTFSSVTGIVNTNEGMASGTSPSITALPSGGYVVAFQANNGSLYTFSSVTGIVNTEEGMASATSPSITALPSGGYVVAFQANNGLLYTFSSVTGIVNTEEGMASATSPSIAALPEGYVVAFQANSGLLYTFSSVTGIVNTEEGMASGTSPSITVLPENGYVVAFHCNNGLLYTFSSAGGIVDTEEMMAAGTSASIM